MFTPRYRLTPALLSHITAIERLYGQIESLRLPEQLDLNLTRHHLIRSTYFSNKIEGNPLSLYEVTNLLTADRAPVSRDEKEVTLYFDLLSRLSAFVSTPLSVDLIRAIHRELFFGIHAYAGTIRDEIVAVGKYTGQGSKEEFRVKHLPPFHARAEIIAALTELTAWLDQSVNLPLTLQAGIFHHQFLYLHPFEDGNGRVCRTLTALIYLKGGYAINRYFVLDDYYDLDRTAYSDALHSADDASLTRWLTYFAHGVQISLESALEKAKSALASVSPATRPTPKEAAVLELFHSRPELTSADIVTANHVSRQQAHHLLSALVAKGWLTRHGSTKSSFYRLK